MDLTRIFAVSLLLLSNLAISWCKTDQQLDELFNSLTYEDKCGQMTQVVVGVLERDDNKEQPPNALDLTKMQHAIKTKKVGSLLGLPYPYVMKVDKWQEIIRTIHDYSLNAEPKTIPILYGLDSIHSASFIDGATAFPQPLSMAATFNVEIAERIGQVIAMEHRSTGSPWNFSPILDIGRQPLWSRLYETMGEDAHVVLKMSTAYIRGHQGAAKDFKNNTKTATCLKHFVGYSFPFNGRDRTHAYIPENLLREHYLPVFENGLKLGSPTVMINSGLVNGVPGHANYHLLTEILKQEMKFEGFTVSDWEDIKRLHTRDKVAETPEDAVRIAVMAGVDMSMVPFDFSFFDHCVNLTTKDQKFAERVDDAAKRILKVKNQMNLFDDPYPDPSTMTNVDLDSSFDFNLGAARESIILAKNEDGTLPISNTARKSILVTGPTANLVKTLNGGWSLGDNEADYHKYGRKKYTVYEAINKTAVDVHEIKFIEGANLTHLTNLNELVSQASKPNVDYVILCVGEGVYSETAGNINDLSLATHQTQLATAILDSTTKPVILLYFGGRPRVIPPAIISRVKAVLIGFLPGDRGGEAVSDILFGHYNPNARLPITYPKAPNGYMTHDYHPVEASEYEFLYEFGHGLSFTTFSYSNLRLNTTKPKSPNGVLGMVDVENTGTVTGKEVVLVYLNDEYSSSSRPVRQLVYFSKISLQPGQSRAVEFEISLDQMSFIDYRGKRTVEAGAFNIYVDKLSAKFILEL